MIYNVSCVGASVNPLGQKILSVIVPCPAFIFPQLLTHRAFSRNAQSSRAMRTCDIADRVLDDAYMPDFVERVKGMGMVGGDAIDDDRLREVQELWHRGRDTAIEIALEMERLGVSKQQANRVLEPYMIKTMLITATDWDNFFKLRIADDAQPEIQIVANQIKELWDTVPYVPVSWGGVHRVFGAKDDIESVERAARVSYMKYKREGASKNGELYNRLLESGHFSPFEHTAYACEGRWDNFTGWKQLRRIVIDGK